MKIFSSFSAFLIAALLCVSAFTALSLPQEAIAQQMKDHRTTPLAVIRFNQPRIYFQRPVANAVRGAMQISPAVKFNLVHYMPGGDYNRMKKAEKGLHAVIQHLYSLGVKQPQISVSKQVANHVPHAEVHIYVR